MERLRTLGLFASLAMLGACTTGPLNGTPYAGASTTGASFTFEGYSNQANQLISLQVLTSPTADPSKDTSWAQFATTRTSTNPIVVAGDTANPLYSWETNAVPAGNGFAGWPVGGVLRTRAISYDNNTNATHQLLTFDEPTFSRCFGAAWAAGETWTQIGQDCAGLGNSVVSLVSSAKNPLTLPAAQQPDWLGYKGDITPQDTETYYGTWSAPQTLASFRDTYGFTSSDPTATYYNDNDLGIGREMHCHKITTGSGGVACYVANYSATAGVGSFGDDPQTVINHAIAHNGAFATVAMVYTPPANTPNSVKFVVYDNTGARTDTAKLDTVGKHVSNPEQLPLMPWHRRAVPRWPGQRQREVPAVRSAAVRLLHDEQQLLAQLAAGAVPQAERAHLADLADRRRDRLPQRHLRRFGRAQHVGRVRERHVHSERLEVGEWPGDAIDLPWHRQGRLPHVPRVRDQPGARLAVVRRLDASLRRHHPQVPLPAGVGGKLGEAPDAAGAAHDAEVLGERRAWPADHGLAVRDAGRLEPDRRRLRSLHAVSGDAVTRAELVRVRSHGQ